MFLTFIGGLLLGKGATLLFQTQPSQAERIRNAFRIILGIAIAIFGFVNPGEWLFNAISKGLPVVFNNWLFLFRTPLSGFSGASLKHQSKN